MSAYLEWLQKQEHKVRRPAHASSAAAAAEPFTSAASRLSDSSATVVVDLAEASDAFQAWRRRRAMTALPTAQTNAATRGSEGDELPALPVRSTKSTLADAASKHALLAKMTADGRKRPLSGVAAASASTARTAADARPPASAALARSIDAASAANAPAAKKVRTAVSRGFVSMRTRESDAGSTSSSISSSNSRSSSTEQNAKSHARKRGIDDVEAPSKRTSQPSKQQKVDTSVADADAGKRTTHRRADGSVTDPDTLSDMDRDTSEDESPVSKPRKRTPLDEALAKIDEKYGALVSFESLGARVAHTAYLPDERAGIQEVRFWSDVDRFASLS